jgi:hypothetical protein
MGHGGEEYGRRGISGLSECYVLRTWEIAGECCCV